MSIERDTGNKMDSRVIDGVQFIKKVFMTNPIDSIPIIQDW